MLQLLFGASLLLLHATSNTDTNTNDNTNSNNNNNMNKQLSVENTIFFRHTFTYRYHTEPMAVVNRGLNIGPIWKLSCDNLFIIQSNLHIRNRISYFICHNSLLEYGESNWWMTDRLLQCLYSASASCNNQSETSVCCAWHMEIPN